MGIEPTWDFVEPHAGFEDQDRHQYGLRLQPCAKLCPVVPQSPGFGNAENERFCSPNPPGKGMRAAGKRT